MKTIVSATAPPWTLHGDPIQGFTVRDANDCLLAPEYSIPEGQARLIAAAPELLAALQALVAKTEQCDNPHDSGVGSSDDTMTIARAAIAKATSGQT